MLLFNLNKISFRYYLVFLVTFTVISQLASPSSWDW